MLKFGFEIYDAKEKNKMKKPSVFKTKGGKMML